ncbi:hypothetical protein OTU49_000117 [Cherax quadricarinatus]|uniref:Fibrinogen C-terminal domain-containing protein n=1 Tax=Cherax quadricarinatus TaxID=27406 RepID=A0AAW0XMV7_CHEQU|nr:techylectin-5A-like [Cherax quadricarinatus]
MRALWTCLCVGVLTATSATKLHNLQREAPIDGKLAMDDYPLQEDDLLDKHQLLLQREDEELAQQNLDDSFLNLNRQEADNTSRHKPVNSAGRPRDCADHLIGGSTTSGIYEIYPFTCTCNGPVRVWCDMETDGGGWTVFLKRQNQSRQVNFNRTWAEYKDGFGDPSREYWLGNEALYKLIASREYAIRLDLEYKTGISQYYTYSIVKVANEANRYRASVQGPVSGTASSNCFSLNSVFTTYDNYGDINTGNCAAVRGGGWWHNSGCRYGNPTSPYNQGLNYTCYSTTSVVTKVQVKIRPTVCDNAFKTVYLNSKNCGGCHNNNDDSRELL